MRFFCLKSCDTCRRALRELRDAGHEVQVVDVRADGVARADLERFFAVFGDALVNRRSTTWRSLGDADRACDPVELLARYPTLMKRPVIEAPSGLFLGWGEDTRAALLG